MSPGPAASSSASAHAGTRDWNAYFAAVAGKPPRDTLLRALELFDADHGPMHPRAPSPHALDIGCGDGRDTAELLRRGWSVHAVDSHPAAILLTDQRRRATAMPPRAMPTLIVQLADMEHVDPTGPFDLINASFSLPFCQPHAFDRLWRAMLAQLASGGRFAGQLFGDRHSWATIPGRTHHTLAHARALLAPLHVEHFEEADKPGFDACGDPVHWHVFHFVAQRRSTDPCRPGRSDRPAP